MSQLFDVNKRLHFSTTLHCLTLPYSGEGERKAGNAPGDKDKEFTKNTGEMITWKAERVGVVMMTKKGRHFI